MIGLNFWHIFEHLGISNLCLTTSHAKRMIIMMTMMTIMNIGIDRVEARRGGVVQEAQETKENKQKSTDIPFGLLACRCA